MKKSVGKSGKTSSNRVFKVNGAIRSANDVGFLFDRYLTKELDRIGVRSSYRQIIEALMEYNSLTQLELVNLIRLKAPTVSITLRSMEQNGFVRREKNSADRRETHVSLTEKGKAAYREIAAALKKEQKLMLAGIPPEELACADAVLRKMGENLIRTFGGEYGA